MYDLTCHKIKQTHALAHAKHIIEHKMKQEHGQPISHTCKTKIVENQSNYNPLT